MNKGTIYTSYFGKKETIGVKVAICLYKPKWLDFESENILHYKGLAPSLPLLEAIKDGQLSFKNFARVYDKQILCNSDTISDIEDVRFILDKGYDVTLLCYEKDRDTCHRSILGNHFENLGYKVEEI